MHPRHCFALNVMNWRMPHVINCQNCDASGRDKALSHRSAPIWKRSSRVILASTCWNMSPLTEYSGIRQKLQGGHEEGHNMTTIALQKTVEDCQKKAEKETETVWWEDRIQEEWIPMSYKYVHAITLCNVEQVLYTQSLPWCQGLASSKFGRGRPVWSMQTQNNKTIWSDHVTWSKNWHLAWQYLTVINYHRHGYSQTSNLFEAELKWNTSVFTQAFSMDLESPSRSGTSMTKVTDKLD